MVDTLAPVLYNERMTQTQAPMSITEILDTLRPSQIRDALVFMSGYSEKGFLIAVKMVSGQDIPAIRDDFSHLL